MKKIWFAQVICLLVLIAAVLLLGVEIFGKHPMDPDRVTLFAVLTGAGLLGTCGCALWRVYRQQAGKK